jgi:tRNA (guanine26-N2/guanine27-N2)-dimethyltransferase
MHNSRYRYVIANDLSASATEVMRKNVEINGLGEQQEASSDAGNPKKTVKRAKVQVNEGDAW